MFTTALGRQNQAAHLTLISTNIHQFIGNYWGFIPNRPWFKTQAE